MKISEAVSKRRATPALERLVRILKGLPAGEVFTKNELEAKYSLSGTKHFSTHPQTSPYRLVHAGTLFFGSKRAIKTFREQLGGDR